MVAYLFVAFAAFFNACMDAWENENFHESIFKNWNQKFWYKRESWKYARKIFGYRLDAWHIAKSCMVICIGLAIGFMDLPHQWWVKLITIGVIWNVVFVTVYHYLFKIK